MPKYTRDLGNAPAIDRDSITVVSEETTNETYKTTLADLLDSSFKDVSAFTTAVGTITKSAGTSATLSSSTDYTAISVGDALIISGTSTNVVVSKDGGTNITVFDSASVSAAAFTYGPPNITTKNSAGNIVNALSSGGVSIDGTSLVTGDVQVGGDVQASGDVQVSGVVKGHEYRAASTPSRIDFMTDTGADLIQRCCGDGMIIKPYLPSFNAGMTANQTSVPSGSWTRGAFNKIDGNDDTKITFRRSPIGQDEFDVTNHVFPVPDGDSYSGALYFFTASFRTRIVASAGEHIAIGIHGASTATQTPPWHLAEAWLKFDVSIGSLTSYTVAVSRIMYLNPAVSGNHSFISCYFWHNCTLATIESDYEGTYFSGTCLG